MAIDINRYLDDWERWIKSQGMTTADTFPQRPKQPRVKPLGSGPGRRPLPPGQRKLQLMFSVHPEVLAFIESLGCASRSVGLDTAIRILMAQRDASLAAIKAAAEARDQSTVKDSAFD